MGVDIHGATSPTMTLRNLLFGDKAADSLIITWYFFIDSYAEENSIQFIDRQI